MSFRNRTPRACLRCSDVRPIEGRGLCSRCWQHLRYHGQMDQYAKQKRSPAEWYDLIDKSEPEGCWIWPGPKNSQTGYGWTGSQTAHRWVYEREIGLIPPKSHVDHTCHSRSISCPGGDHCPHRPCCNPAHLEVVTPRENARRGTTRRTHCKRGHLVVKNESGQWACAECHADRKREWNAANRLRVNQRRREKYAARRPVA
jgi:hypothetical protein